MDRDLSDTPLQTGRQTPARANLATVVRELPADLETPVSVYLKLAGQGPAFLLESITGGEHVARYSFIGVHPRRAYVIRGASVECHAAGQTTQRSVAEGTDLLDFLRNELARFTPRPMPGLPRFAGGLVGYLGYETVRYFEPTLSLQPHAGLPDAVFLLADTVIAFDHAFGKLLLIANVDFDQTSGAGRGEAVARGEATARLDELQRRLAGPLPARAALVDAAPATGRPLRSNLEPEAFMAAVLAGKEYIAAGDIFQVVLSQRFSRQTAAEPFSIYRALRRLNPSPYMFFVDFAGLVGPEPLRLIGASPEMHVRLEGRRAAIRPIAGTRPRSPIPAEDAALERELLADPKERA